MENGVGIKGRDSFMFVLFLLSPGYPCAGSNQKLGVTHYDKLWNVFTHELCSDKLQSNKNVSGPLEMSSKTCFVAKVHILWYLIFSCSPPLPLLSSGGPDCHAGWNVRLPSRSIGHSARARLLLRAILAVPFVFWKLCKYRILRNKRPPPNKRPSLFCD